MHFLKEPTKNGGFNFFFFVWQKFNFPNIKTIQLWVNFFSFILINDYIIVKDASTTRPSIVKTHKVW